MALLPFCSQWTQFLHCVVECKSFYTGLLNPKFLHRLNYCYCHCSHWTKFLHRVVKCNFFTQGCWMQKHCKSFGFAHIGHSFYTGLLKAKVLLNVLHNLLMRRRVSRLVENCKTKVKRARAQYVQSIQLLDLRVTSPLTVFLKYGQLDFSKAFDSISDHLISIFPEIFGFSEYFRIWLTWVTRSEHPKSAKDKVTRSRSHEGPETSSIAYCAVHVG